MTEEQKPALIEVARKRLSQYQKMNEAQKSSVRPRGGIEIDYGVSIALMEIALAALNAQPVNLPQSFYGVVQSGKVVMLPADDGQWLNKTTVAEAFRALEQRAEAAESNYANEYDARKQVERNYAMLETKMAELAKQDTPVAMRVRYHPSPCCAGSWVYVDIDKFKADTTGRYQEQELFTRPAPAADLADARHQVKYVSAIWQRLLPASAE